MTRALPLLLLATLAAAGDPDPAWLLMTARDGSVWVREDGKEVRRAGPAAAPRGDAALSPDGEAWLVARNQRGNGGVFLLPVEGGEMRRLIRETDGARWPSWCADGVRFVYAAPAGGTWQLFRASVADEPVRGERLTKEEGDVLHACTSPDGQRVAYVVRTPTQRRSKLPHGDVVMLELATGKRTVLAEGVAPLELSWSPGGGHLAVSTASSLDLFDPATGERARRIVPSDIHADLYAHGAHDLCWRPDGKVLACRITFLGGRAAAADGTFEAILGDHELFFLPLEGNPAWIELPKDVHRGPFRWGAPPAGKTR